LAELLTSDLSCLENQGEPFASGPLDEEDDAENKDEGPVLVEELLKDVVLTWSNHTAVDLVEELEEHEGSEDHCHMSLFGDCHRLFWAFRRSVTISVLGASISGLGVFFVVKTVNGSAHPDDNEHDCNHPNCDSINLAPDGLVKDLGLDCDGWLVDNGGKWLHSCEGHGTKDIHNEVDPDELGRAKWRLGQEDASDDNGNKTGNVAGNLELQESSHVGVNVASPHNSTQDCFEVVGTENH